MSVGMDPLTVALGVGLALGVAGMGHALRRQPTRRPDHGPGPDAEPLPDPLAAWWQRTRPLVLSRRTLLCLAVGTAGLLLTGWPLLLPMGAAAAWTLPGLLGSDRAQQQRVRRIEALATWTEQLRDTLAAASGLEQGIRATASLAPEAIRPQVTALVANLDARMRLPQALTLFAEELADPAADLVAIALISGSARQSGRLADLLGTLAASSRAQVVTRVRASAARASTRTSVRVITITTFVLAAALIVINSSFLRPYQSLGGQLALAAVAGIFTLAFHWLVKINTFPEPPRLLNPHTAAAHLTPTAGGPR
ncbi:tight adherence protein B [Streptacidiphilus sp. MAP12-16]|uniref:type II secretion system F family protein n=1 Tax=Streptacidiphilus sp. MAP12-16 TaxID=3156300 RepID=UPI003518CE69